MSGAFREACRVMAATMGGSGSEIKLPGISNTMGIARKMGANSLTIAGQANLASLNQVAEKLLQAIRQQINLTPKQLRDAIWCLWETKPALAAEPAALAAIVEGVTMSAKRKPFRNLAAVYLVQFRPDRPGLDTVSAVLQRLASKWGDPWASHQQKYTLYDPARGPRNIAAKAITDSVSPTEALKSIDLGALDAQSGFSEEITRNLLVELANGTVFDHARRLEKVKTVALDARGEPLFKSLDLEIAEALMMPFLGKAPERLIKDIFLNFIVSIFRDPRIYPMRWQRFPHIKALVISWLTEQSLRQFLDIVGRTIDDPADAEMWKYRRAFWEAAHRKGIIKGAWVVFADDGALRARHSFGNNAGFGIFGGRGGKQIQRTHAVLLLEIGKGVVADWSHDGKVNVWSDAEERGAPKLYLPKYSSADVSISSSRYDQDTPRYLVKTHHAPKSYNWQRVVAQRIYQMTNTRLSDSEYRA
ncbi:EH signature domain-containing protein [Rhizobium herbae]